VTFVHERWAASRKWLLTGLAGVCTLAMWYSVVYSYGVVLSAPISNDTREVIQYIRDIPDHAHRRFFITEYDNHRLAREVPYRSFLLRGNPIYFRLDKVQADSIDNAYRAIVNRGPDAKHWLEIFNTEYAVIGKEYTNISPVRGKRTRGEHEAAMRDWFDRRSTKVLENNQWVIYRLSYPLGGRSQSGLSDP
jgi:hypothetical protein